MEEINLSEISRFKDGDEPFHRFEQSVWIKMKKNETKLYDVNEAKKSFPNNFGGYKVI